MGKHFAFSSRAVRMQFFDDEPIELTMMIGDETDAHITDSGKQFVEAEKEPDCKKRAKQFEAALVMLIGKEKTEEILSRADVRDSYSVSCIYHFILSEYRDQKVKNLSASAR